MRGMRSRRRRALSRRRATARGQGGHAETACPCRFTAPLCPDAEAPRAATVDVRAATVDVFCRCTDPRSYTSYRSLPTPRRRAPSRGGGGTSRLVSATAAPLAVHPVPPALPSAAPASAPLAVHPARIGTRVGRPIGRPPLCAPAGRAFRRPAARFHSSCSRCCEVGGDVAALLPACPFRPTAQPLMPANRFCELLRIENIGLRARFAPREGVAPPPPPAQRRHLGSDSLQGVAPPPPPMLSHPCLWNSYP